MEEKGISSESGKRKIYSRDGFRRIGRDCYRTGTGERKTIKRQKDGSCFAGTLSHGLQWTDRFSR